MALQSVAAPPEVNSPENNGAFDTTTLHRLWEIQCICRMIRASVDPESGGTDPDDEHVWWALNGVERLLDVTIRRNGQNTALQFDGDD